VTVLARTAGAPLARRSRAEAALTSASARHLLKLRRRPRFSLPRATPNQHHTTMSIVDILLCIFLPPLAVFLRKGAGKDFVINLVLWVLTFGLLGIVHAFWLLTKKPA
jgi:uncharacterized membrane protein YqaE (UPF0057 family)